MPIDAVDSLIFLVILFRLVIPAVLTTCILADVSSPEPQSMGTSSAGPVCGIDTLLSHKSNGVDNSPPDDDTSEFVGKQPIKSVRIKEFVRVVIRKNTMSRQSPTTLMVMIRQ